MLDRFAEITMLELLMQIKTNYDSVKFNKYLCGVLDESIGCLKEEKGVTTTSAYSNASGCSRMWTGATCWPSSAFNTTVWLPCSGTSSNESDSSVLQMARHCNVTSRGWNAKLSQHDCFQGIRDQLDEYDDAAGVGLGFNSSNEYGTEGATSHDEILYYVNEGNVQESLDDDFVRHTTLMKVVTVGHSLSIFSLLFALVLLAFLKRLHCPRIFIHMNLMATFMLRGLIWILHHAAFQDPNLVEEIVERKSMELTSKIMDTYSASDLPVLLSFKKELCVTSVDPTNYVWCRLYYVFLNYLVTANYYWLLVEGLYLRILLRAVRFSHKTYMKFFVFLGWFCPWISVLGSVLAKSLDPEENTACWFEDSKTSYKWIIKVPILLSLTINFAIFVLVVREVGLKLRMNQRHHAVDGREDYRWRLAKSTATLIPLLGIQYTVTAFLDVANVKNPNALFAKKAYEASFTSIQGLFVALIYCFFTREVQEECGKIWRGLKTSWELSRREQHQMKKVKRRKSTVPSNASEIPNTSTFYISRKISDTSFNAGRTSFATTRLLSDSCTVRSSSPPRTQFKSRIGSKRLSVTPSIEPEAPGSSAARASLQSREDDVFCFEEPTERTDKLCVECGDDQGKDKTPGIVVCQPPSIRVTLFDEASNKLNDSNANETTTLLNGKSRVLQGLDTSQKGNNRFELKGFDSLDSVCV